MYICDIAFAIGPENLANRPLSQLTRLCKGPIILGRDVILQRLWVLLYRTPGITLDQNERLILGFAKSRSYRFSKDLLVH